METFISFKAKCTSVLSHGHVFYLILKMYNIEQWSVVLLFFKIYFTFRTERKLWYGNFFGNVWLICVCFFSGFLFQGRSGEGKHGETYFLCLVCSWETRSYRCLPVRETVQRCGSPQIWVKTRRNYILIY